MKILVVDDVARSFAALSPPPFKAPGHQAITAASGREALACLRSQRNWTCCFWISCFPT